MKSGRLAKFKRKSLYCYGRKFWHWRCHCNCSTGAGSSGKSDAREMDELDNNEMNPTTYKALSEGNPVKAEYMLLERELSQLSASRQRYYEGKANDEKHLLQQQGKLPLYEKRLELTGQDIAQAARTQFMPFEMTLFYKGQTKRYTSEDKKTEVGEQLMQVIRENVSDTPEKIKIATYRGFEIYHVSHPQTNLLGALDDGGELIKIKGETEYTLKLPMTSGTGTLERLNNKIDSLVKDQEATKQEVNRLRATITRIENDREKPFSKEQVFYEKSERFETLRNMIETGEAEKEKGAIQTDEGLEMFA